MKHLAYGAFTVEEVREQLHKTGRMIDFRYDLVSPEGVILGALDQVVDASVANDTTADIKRTAKFRIKDTEEINWLRDRITPWFRLHMGAEEWAEWPLGLFLLSTPKRDIGKTNTLRRIEAYDQLLVLMDNKTTGRHTSSAGGVVTSQVTDLLNDNGFDVVNVVASTETLPVARDWPPGTPFLEIINDLLASIDYRPLHFDSAGVPVVIPYQRPDERGTEYLYAADAESVIHPEMSSSLDLFKVPNTWLATVSEPDRPPLSSIYINSNPLSPTSTVSRGRTILEVLEPQEATSQAVLDSLVQRVAFDASQVFESLSFDTALMPHHEDQDLLEIQYDRLDTSSRRYVENAWSMTLKAGTMMSHELQRVVVV